MPTEATPPHLVGEEWQPSSYEDAGVDELEARIETAEPRILPRAALDGRCGLPGSELWRLGVETVPPSALSFGGSVLLRLAVLGATSAVAFSLSMAAGMLSLLDEHDLSTGVPGGIAVAVMFAGIAYGCFQGAWAAAGRERERRLDLRRAAPRAVAPREDPHARFTVAVLDGPGVLRVLLLWLRGHHEDADLLEVRVLAERRVPRDEPARAEDALAAFSDTVLLATHAQQTPELRPATSAEPTDAVRRALRATHDGDRAADRASAPTLRVGPDWHPDGTTEAGESELARRLVLARPERWSAELLAPLVADGIAAGEKTVPEPAQAHERTPERPRRLWVTAPGLVLVTSLLYFVFSATGDELALEVTMRSIFLAAAAFTTWRVFGPQLRELPHRRRRRPLLRRVDEAASDAAGPLEEGLPGGHGTVVVTATRAPGGQLVRLVHLRRIVDAPEGTLEARVLAEQVAARGAEAREAIGRFLLVADDQAFTSGRGRRSLARLRRFARALGVTPGAAPARGQRADAVAVLAVPPGVLSVGLALVAIYEGLTGRGDVLAVAAAATVAALVARTLRACSGRWTSLS